MQGYKAKLVTCLVKSKSPLRLPGHWVQQLELWRGSFDVLKLLWRALGVPG
jgi:hypothetical protein